MKCLLFTGVAVSLFASCLGAPGLFDEYNKLITRLTCAEMPNNGTCAIIFDNDDCDGWQLHVNEGYTELPKKKLSFRDKVKEDDAEAVLLRNGCVFIGYEEYKADGYGKSIAVSASEGHKYQDFDEDGFEDLDEEISAVFCTCKGLPHSQK